MLCLAGDKLNLNTEKTGEGEDGREDLTGGYKGLQDQEWKWKEIICPFCVKATN